MKPGNLTIMTALPESAGTAAMILFAISLAGYAGLQAMRNLNVRQTEVLASESGAKTAPKPEKEKDVFTRDAEEKLQRTLRTKVEIDRRRRGGVIHIRFASEEDLIRVVDDLMGRRR